MAGSPGYNVNNQTKPNKPTKRNGFQSSRLGAAETNATGNHEVAGSIPGLDPWVKDPALLWLWCRLAAVAQIRPLAWEPPYAMGVALKKRKEKKRKEMDFTGKEEDQNSGWADFL